MKLSRSRRNYLKSGYNLLLQRDMYPTEEMVDAMNAREMISDGSLALSQIGGKATLISNAFNNDGNLITELINAKLDTQSKKILQAFDVNTEDYAGAVKSGNITWNLDTGAWESGAGVVVSKAGIIGASVTGVTFSLDASDGSATFAGDLVGASGTFGSVYSASAGYRIGLFTSGGVGQLATYNGNTLIGAIYTDSSGWMKLVAPSNSIMLSSGGANVFEVALSGALPAANDTFDLGITARRWRNLFLSGSATITTGITTGSVNCNSVSATSLSGALTGNVTGNCSGNHSGSFNGTVTASGGSSSTGLRIVIDIRGERVAGTMISLDKKTRDFDFSSGIVTSLGSESGWTNCAY